MIIPINRHMMSGLRAGCVIVEHCLTQEDITQYVIDNYVNRLASTQYHVYWLVDDEKYLDMFEERAPVLHE